METKKIPVFWSETLLPHSFAPWHIISLTKYPFYGLAYALASPIPFYSSMQFQFYSFCWELIQLYSSCCLHSFLWNLPLNFRPHYSVNMTAVQVGSEFLNISRDVFEGDSRGTILDSGTTLAYLPEIIYDTLISKVRDQKSKAYYLI